MHGGNAVFNIRGTDDNTGIQITGGGEVTHCAAVAATTGAFGSGDQLHGAHFRCTAQRAHVHTGLIGVQHVKVGAQGADHSGNQVHYERVAVHFGQIGHVAAAGLADARQIVSRQIDQHQVLGQLFMVSTHF